MVNGVKGIELFLVFWSATLPLFAQEFDLFVQEGLVTLDSERAMLSQVLLDLQRYYPGVDATSVEDREITWRCRELPVDEFLGKLGINFMGVFQPGGSMVEVMTLGARLEEIMGEVDLPSELRAKILEYLSWLNDDDISFNASRGLWKLVELGSVVEPFMKKALDSEDYQARQFAAEVLVDLGTNITRNATLDSVIIEGMADDEYPAGKDARGNYRYTYLNNAQRAMGYFGNDREAVDRAKPMLSATLNSGDGQQRLLAAWALGLHGHTEHAISITQILINHLADNEISGDSNMAVNALYGLGEPIRPLLEPYVNAEDGQQSRLVAEVLEFLGTDAGRPNYRRIGMWGWEPQNFPPPQ